MVWNVIRKATSEDHERLEATARRFVKRHNITCFDEDNLAWCVDICVEDRDADVARLWKRCVARALYHPRAEGIAYDHIGYST